MSARQWNKPRTRRDSSPEHHMVGTERKESAASIAANVAAVFEQGIGLLRTCYETLERAEAKIEILTGVNLPMLLKLATCRQRDAAAGTSNFPCSRVSVTISPMPDIVLATLNAKFIHASFGLRYLLANLGELKARAGRYEFDINQRPLDIAEILLAQHPRIIGLGVYIWNVAETTKVVAAVKRIQPGVTVILGGPEVSYETDQQEIVRLADHVITGEGDLEFARVCRGLLAGEPTPNPSKEGN